MPIQNFITRTIVSVEMDDTLAEVRNIFNHVKFHHLLVMNKERLVGIISDRDLLKELSPRIEKGTASEAELAVLKKRAHQIMSRKLITLSSNASFKDLLKTFLDKNISCIPILDKQGKVEGVVTWKDVFRYLLSINKEL